MLLSEVLVIVSLSSVTLAPEEMSAAFSSVPVDSNVSFDTVVSSVYSFTAV